MTFWWFSPLILLTLAVLVEEAWVWVLTAGRGLGEEAETVCRGREGRLSAVLFLSLFSLGIMVALVKANPASPLLLWLAIVLATAVLGAGWIGASWRGSVTIPGRTVLLPLRPLGWFLDRLVHGFPPAHQGKDTSWEFEVWESSQDVGEAAEKALATLQEFRRSSVEDVMIPREEIEGLRADWTVTRAIDVIRDKGFSRYPVYAESLDTVTGVLHVFDLVGADSQETVDRFTRPPFMTTETKPITSLLKELQHSYNQMAIVVDEMGGTAGLVTVEDLLEELVGEIEDESDDQESLLRVLGAGVYWVDASLRIEALNESLDLSIPEGEYDTVAGLLLEYLERIPKIGERVMVAGILFEIVAAEPNRVGSLKLYLRHSEKQSLRR